MQVKVKKWGNKLALCIPESLASEVSLKPDKLVNLSVSGDSIIVTPVGEEEYSLEELLEGVSENNLHGEFNTGAPAGKEIW